MVALMQRLRDGRRDPVGAVRFTSGLILPPPVSSSYILFMLTTDITFEFIAGYD